MFEACGIAEAKDEETARFISRKVDVAAELAENQAYLEIISEEGSISNSNDKSGGSGIDLGSDISVEVKEALSFGQTL